MMWQIVFLLTFLFISLAANRWNYGQMGPDIWSDFYPSCAGQSQSPVNILTACTVYRPYPPVVFALGNNERRHFVLKNNGYTIVGTINEEHEQAPIRLSGGGLNGTFDFVNFHLHWGENYKSGSEHQINGVKYAGEIHFVFRNHQTSQTAVLGMFMQSSPDSNAMHLDRNQHTRDEWRRYFDRIPTLQAENDSVESDFHLISLMGENLAEFWRYRGSLTTPPCTEGVVWTIFKQPIVFTERQLQILRENIYFEDYRGPQPLYNRKIERNFLNESISSVPDYQRCIPHFSDEASTSLSSVFNVMNYSTYSCLLLLFLLYSVLILAFFIFCKVRDTVWRKKFQ